MQENIEITVKENPINFIHLFLFFLLGFLIGFAVSMIIM